jgi:putative nucleotidyltransferase with HDIG domain
MNHPPRLVVRTLAVIFLTVAAILSAVFMVLTVDVRDRVRNAETARLRDSERMFTTLDAARQKEQLAMTATLGENPTLKAALDTYFTESRFSALEKVQEASLRATVTREAEKLATMTSADVLAILGSDGRVFAAAGRSSDRWPRSLRVELQSGGEATFQDIVAVSGSVYRVSAARLWLNDLDIGSLVVARNLDTTYAKELSDLSSAGVVIAIADRVLAATVADDVAAELARTAGVETTQRFGGEEYAVRTLFQSGEARIFTLVSIDAAARTATQDALVTLALTALGSFALAGAGSLWLARQVSEPINRVAGTIASMTSARDFSGSIALPGTSQELDALAQAFNELLQNLGIAEAETQSAYLGAIRALAATLDARDPYTAGHSERVSTLSVQIGRQMGLNERELDVLRLGALLHDIGKIGLTDQILRKPGPLTAEEFEQIKQHPGLGARILRQVPFLAPHLPIVELHHEQPDGRGYPFGLRGDEIPIPARIVHVADTFDAMTSTRAYRRALSAEEAFAELNRHAGVQFDPDCVRALCQAPPSSDWKTEPELHQLLGREVA